MNEDTAIDRKPSVLQGVTIIDADTHVTEVHDLAFWARYARTVSRR